MLYIKIKEIMIDPYKAEHPEVELDKDSNKVRVCKSCGATIK